MKTFFVFILIFASLLLAGCQRSTFDKGSVAPASLRDVQALKLNFRFEPDVPEPSVANQQNLAEEKNAGVQTHFDNARPQEVLEKTFTSPDKQRVVAVYKKAGDLNEDFRLDLYAPDGTLIRPITPNGMAVRFPDTTVWSPDSGNLAFVAVTRTAQTSAATETAPTPPSGDDNSNVVNNNSNADATSNANANETIDANVNANAAVTPEAAKGALTFRTEQIYISNREGLDLKPLTQNEGLIYFYFVWSPDSAALVSLAATWREWQVGLMQAGQRGEVFVPAGRPRLVEKTGRERRLDDNVTPVQPVWSPDSSKVALAFDKEVRVYDAIGDAPTQAAIPLRNQLLISSKAFDDELRRKEQSGSAANTNATTNTANANVNQNANANQNTNIAPIATDINALPDENMLVSFNPIVELRWTEDALLYMKTGFIREYREAAENRYSYLRWHRLALSPQAVVIN